MGIKLGLFPPGEGAMYLGQIQTVLGKFVNKYKHFGPRTISSAPAGELFNLNGARTGNQVRILKGFSSSPRAFFSTFLSPGLLSFVILPTFPPSLRPPFLPSFFLNFLSPSIFFSVPLLPFFLSSWLGWLVVVWMLTFLTGCHVHDAKRAAFSDLH